MGASVAGLITSIIVKAMTATVKWAQGITKSLAQTARDATKKLGPWALPLAAFVYWMLNGGAAVLSWLSKNLWVVLIAVAIA